MHDWLGWLRSRLANKPRILLGWSSDPLLGHLGQRESVLRMVRAAARWGFQVCLKTAVVLDDSETDLLKPYASQIKFLVPLLGFAPTPTESSRVVDRLEVVRKLRRCGLSPKMGWEPMLPGIHDRPEAIEKILRDVAILGPGAIQVGFLALPEDRRGNLLPGPLEAARRGGYGEGFVDGPSMVIAGARMRLLPLPARQKSFARIHAMAAARGIRVDVCPWSNPDFVKQTQGEAPKNAAPRISLAKRFLELSLPS